MPESFELPPMPVPGAAGEADMYGRAPAAPGLDINAMQMPNWYLLCNMYSLDWCVWYLLFPFLPDLCVSPLPVPKAKE